MTSYQIELAIRNHVNTVSGVVFDLGSPTTFDPKAEGVTDWVAVTCSTIEEPPTRRTAKRRSRVTVSCRCWSRTVDTVRPEKRLGEQIAGVLRHAVVPVIDYGTEGEPQVGTITLNEPRITDDNDQELIDGYALALVRVTGIAQEV